VGGQGDEITGQMVKRTPTSPAANHLTTWKRSSTWVAWPKWAPMAALVGLTAVGDDDLDTPAPALALFDQKSRQGNGIAVPHHAQNLAGLAVEQHGDVRVVHCPRPGRSRMRVGRVSCTVFVRYPHAGQRTTVRRSATTTSRRSGSSTLTSMTRMRGRWSRTAIQSGATEPLLCSFASQL
jgi:hypothetical protein